TRRSSSSCGAPPARCRRTRPEPRSHGPAGRISRSTAASPMRSRSWVVQAPCTLAGVLEAMGSAGAVQQGRVFVDGRRALADTGELVAGSIVEVFEARPPLE